MCAICDYNKDFLRFSVFFIASEKYKICKIKKAELMRVFWPLEEIFEPYPVENHDPC